MKATLKSFDICALGAQDNTFALPAGPGAAAAGVSVTAPNDGTNVIYITGIIITSTAPAATVSGVVTITGLVSGTLSFEFVESATLGGVLQVPFGNPIPAVNVSTSVVLSVPAITSGGAVAVVLMGYRRPE